MTFTQQLQLEESQCYRDYLDYQDYLNNLDDKIVEDKTFQELIEEQIEHDILVELLYC